MFQGGHSVFRGFQNPSDYSYQVMEVISDKSYLEEVKKVRIAKEVMAGDVSPVAMFYLAVLIFGVLSTAARTIMLPTTPTDNGSHDDGGYN